MYLEKSWKNRFFVLFLILKVGGHLKINRGFIKPSTHNFVVKLKADCRSSNRSLYLNVSGYYKISSSSTSITIRNALMLDGHCFPESFFSTLPNDDFMNSANTLPAMR